MRIALLAMSGVRAYDPELTALGLTLPGFVERGLTIAALPSLSLLTLAGFTPDRHELTYHDIDRVDEIDALPECDLAAISTYSAQADEAYALADRYRTARTPTVIGGLHATALPNEAGRHCDAVVVGEGEPVWRRVVADAEAGRLQPIYRSDAPGYRLGEGPLPRFDLLEPERYNRFTVQTQRGCPWQCEFCASSILLTPRYKQKPVDRVVEEIRAIKKIWPRPFVELADDNTFVNKRHCRRLVSAIGDEGVRWFTETDVSVAEDDDLLAMMRSAGCAEILVGFESPTPEGVDGIELKRNWKREQFNAYHEAVQRIQSHGIAVSACFVLGLDGDGPGVFDDVEGFVTTACPFDVQITVLTPFPGTPLYARLAREGRLLHPGDWARCTLFDVTYRPRQMTAGQLRRGLVDLGRRIYSEEATADRRAGFKEQWRSGRSSRRCA
jgi:radical SAM superfamily enzyme YgiQ (UPF0313 family)